MMTMVTVDIGLFAHFRAYRLHITDFWVPQGQAQTNRVGNALMAFPTTVGRDCQGYNHAIIALYNSFVNTRFMRGCSWRF